MRKQILGVNIDDISMDEVLKTVEGWLSRSGKHYIVTPNPEFLVTANSNNRFQMILNRSNLSIPDGVGLRLGGVKNRVSGTDLMEGLIKLANEKGYTIGLLGGRDEVAEKTAECLRKRYPKLKISFMMSDIQVGMTRQGAKKHSANQSETSNNSLASLEARPAPTIEQRGSPHFLTAPDFVIPATDILFVAFGHPKQEYWIAENLPKIKVKVAMGVGGAFDYFSGKIPRAPKLIRSLGLEWLFRLMVQPWRIRRQLALIKYIYLLTRAT